VQGTTLDEYCEISNLLPLGKVVEIGFKVIRALEYAFQMGVIHRDIKPGNVLMGPDGDVKVTDFGASFQEKTTSETTQLHGVGSPAYMSPEQIRMEPLNHQTDIYAVGVLLFKLLTGRLPYNASNQLSLTYEILNVPAPLPSTFRPELPKILDEICVKAMEKDLSNRYASWVDFGKDLSRAFTAMRALGGSISDSEKYSELRAMAFFSDFDDVVLWEALRIGTWHEIPAGVEVVREGDIGDSIFLLIKGEVSVTLQQSPLAVLKPGGCFGELLYFTEHNTQRTTSITSITAITVMEIKARVMRLASDACQVAFQKGFIRVLIDRNTQANRRIVSAAAPLLVPQAPAKTPRTALSSRTNEPRPSTRPRRTSSA
jgi:eukaryotic-like serine/threonine-protein kinase